MADVKAREFELSDDSYPRTTGSGKDSVLIYKPPEFFIFILSGFLAGSCIMRF
jgi:hypothetical protein